AFDLIYGLPTATVALPAATLPLITLRPENGTSPFHWTVLSGVMPVGLRLDDGGELTGAALVTGTFPLVVLVQDGIGLTAQGNLTLAVSDPDIPLARLTSSFLLTGLQLTTAQVQFLDREGNGDGTYDLGDFRAWVLAHPDLPLTAEVEALVGPRTVVVPMGSAPTGDGSGGGVGR
ncbi:MAG TPA: hypothetical protein VJ997_11135, partial [Longimicrobiales bacterium]|nr:hypothetical protein [Longimicrobiales bacterium]